MTDSRIIVYGQDSDGNYVPLIVNAGAINVNVLAIPPVLRALDSGFDLLYTSLVTTPYNKGLYTEFNWPAPGVPAPETFYPIQIDTGQARGLLVRPYFSNVVPTIGTYTISVQGLIGSTDGTPVDADWETILTSAPIAAAVGWGPTLRISPNLLAVANLIAQDIIYPAIRVGVNVPLNTGAGTTEGRIVVGLAC